MDIHVVRPGDTLYELAYQYGVPMSRLIQDNQLPDPSQLVVGQTLVIQYPRSTYTVRSGDTLFSIARNAGVPLRQLLRNNPGLEGKLCRRDPRAGGRHQRRRPEERRVHRRGGHLR